MVQNNPEKRHSSWQGGLCTRVPLIKWQWAAAEHTLQDVWPHLAQHMGRSSHGKSCVCFSPRPS